MLFLWEIIEDTLLDTVKLIPFLFITYLLMEYLEHKAGEHTGRIMQRAGKFGPFIGAITGVVPQCGFSAAAANLFAGGVISLGTLLAIFLSTSDEMLPILISEQAAAGLILKILGLKVLIGAAAGFLVDLLYRRKWEEHDHIHQICESEHCHCEKGIFRSALSHTIQITLFILLISFVLNLILHGIGEDALEGLFFNRPVIGQLIAGLLGLIPNCASSVAITQLYLKGIMSFGGMMAGLLVNAGVGLLVLCRINHNRRENARVIGILYLVGVIGGLLLDLLGI